ncbi:MAG TPA: histidinol-phosphate transaminase [Roseiflexaceae bacterium]|nr:histidinol-phosphate transaminase [Roseiflexaceae bacterium]
MPSATHLLRPDIAALESYTPIVPLEVLAARLGLPIDQLVKLDANENPYGPSPRALAAMASYPYYAIYPDPEHGRLREKLSHYVGQPPERIICGAGADELIDLLMRAFLTPGDAIINCPPTFGMYAFDAALQAARVINVPRDEAFDVDIEAVAQASEDHGAKMVILTSPNNPSGNLMPRADIERLLELPLLVVVDEAYTEFAGSSVVDLVGHHPNLVVLRTFSKWAGLAGLRVGYGIVHEEIITHLWKIKQPYNVNVAAQVAAEASLDDLEYLTGNIMRIVAERERLYEALSALSGLHVYPSRANFLLCRVLGTKDEGRRTKEDGSMKNSGSSATEIKDALAQQGILIRYYRAPELRDCIRVSVGTPEQNDTFLAALRGLFA